jgi:UDP-2,4-diacetamido-2,4,6-trideoxy-beta-L-altropyranose hydrolase
MPMPSIRELPPLLVRADASAAIGTGHVIRSLALIQAWLRQGGAAIFLSRCDNGALREHISAAGMDFIPLESNEDSVNFEAMRALLAQKKTFFVVLDGYHFGPEQQKAVRAAGHRLLFIDDMAHFSNYHADILLNQNIGASKLSYRCEPKTMLLLGPRYALLRPEFAEARRRVRTVREAARRILVTLGGCDSENVTLKVIGALRRLGSSRFEVRIVLGSANPHVDSIRAAAASLPMFAEVLIDARDMASQISWADVAITAAGSTCWELACLGLTPVTIVIAENQRAVADELDMAGIALNAGWHGDLSAEHLTMKIESLLYSSFRRLRMSQQGRELVDGRGADRVISALLNLSCVEAA